MWGMCDPVDPWITGGGWARATGCDLTGSPQMTLCRVEYVSLGEMFRGAWGRLGGWFKNFSIKMYTSLRKEAAESAR